MIPFDATPRDLHHARPFMPRDSASHTIQRASIIAGCHSLWCYPNGPNGIACADMTPGHGDDPLLFLEDAGDGWIAFTFGARSSQIHLDAFPAWLRIQLGLQGDEA